MDTVSAETSFTVDLKMPDFFYFLNFYVMKMGPRRETIHSCLVRTSKMASGILSFSSVLDTEIEQSSITGQLFRVKELKLSMDFQVISIAYQLAFGAF